MKKINGNGFTLVELVAVFAILAILVGITIPVLQSAYRKSKISKAKSEIAKLDAAAYQYKCDWGSYPATGSAALYSALRSTSPVTKKPYIEFRSADISGGTIIDSWGIAYIYKNPGSHNPNTIDIYSCGSNKTDDNGGADDITNWAR